MTTTTSLQIAGQTDVGQHRRDNQDTFISTPLWSAHDALLVVIDGVGGTAGGAQAAALAKEAIGQYMTTPSGDTLTMLREAVVHANNQIVKQRQQDPELARMSCVLTATVVDTEARRLLFVHVGDTRLYRLRQGQFDKLTHDHSLVGVREDANQLTEGEAMHHPRRHEILRDVGSAMHRVDDPAFLESGETDFLPGDALLLCSDGLTDMLTRQQLTDVLTRPLSVSQQAAELIRQANEQGGQDNITVVLARFMAPATNHIPSPSPAAATPQTSVTQPITTVPSPIPAVAKPAPARLWVWGLLGLALLLGWLMWWQTADPIAPASPPQPLPVDSSARTVPAMGKQPDSLKKP